MILTATRTSEALNATWDEFDLEAEVWTIPAGRMKARVEHRVPLSQRAMQILHELKEPDAESTDDDYVFAGQREGTPLSNMALLLMLRRMKRDDVTGHGFRSSFSDWASEVSSFSGELRETALAHTIQKKAERAYRRGDALEKRPAMMVAWGARQTRRLTALRLAKRTARTMSNRAWTKILRTAGMRDVVTTKNLGPPARKLAEVAKGRLSREEAEGWARGQGLKPFAYKPDVPAADVMALDYWTAPMAAAWFNWRSPDAVRDQWDKGRQGWTIWERIPALRRPNSIGLWRLKRVGPATLAEVFSQAGLAKEVVRSPPLPRSTALGANSMTDNPYDCVRLVLERGWLQGSYSVADRQEEEKVIYPDRWKSLLQQMANAQRRTLFLQQERAATRHHQVQATTKSYFTERK